MSFPERSQGSSVAHERTTTLMVNLAQAHGVELTPRDKNNWVVAFTVAKALDTLTDERHEYDTAAYAHRLLVGEPVPYVSEQLTAQFPEFYASLALEQQQAYVRATYLGAYALRRLQVKDIDDYILVVREESQLMADVLKLENSSMDARRQTFNDWLEVFGRAAYSTDTISDFIRDKNEGNHNLQITPMAYRRLAQAALGDLRVLARESPPGIYGPILWRGFTKTVEKARVKGFLAHQFMSTKCETRP